MEIRRTCHRFSVLQDGRCSGAPSWRRSRQRPRTCSALLTGSGMESGPSVDGEDAAVSAPRSRPRARALARPDRPGVRRTRWSRHLGCVPDRDRPERDL
jgi:hypothetical protein